MNLNVFYGILIPFIGTSAGAACVFFMKKDLNRWVQRCLTGFAVRRNGKALFCTGSSWLLGRGAIPVFVGSYYSTPASTNR